MRTFNPHGKFQITRKGILIMKWLQGKISWKEYQRLSYPKKREKKEGFK